MGPHLGAKRNIHIKEVDEALPGGDDVVHAALFGADDEEEAHYPAGEEVLKLAGEEANFTSADLWIRAAGGGAEAQRGEDGKRCRRMELDGR